MFTNLLAIFVLFMSTCNAQSSFFVLKYTIFIQLKLVDFYLVKPVPVVIWHGMGDSCCNAGSMGRIKDVIEGVSNYFNK
jgi:hypothetical protein